ncbi:MAG: DUF6391 domain-containing protein [Dehalococcoidia bacterium]
MLGSIAGRWLESVRRNHALEHATVAVLFARHGPSRIAGRAAGNGFFLLGDVSPDELGDAAAEALQRLQQGQASLAVSPLCGTNLAVAGFLGAGAATAAMHRDSGRFGNAFTMTMFAVMMAQPVGRVVQKYLTTSPHLEGVEVVGVRKVVGGLMKVQTRSAS